MNREKIQKYVPNDREVRVDGNVGSFEVALPEIEEVVARLHGDSRLSLKLITATDERKEDGCFKIWYVFGSPEDDVFISPFISLKGVEEFPSVTSIMHEAFNYERKIKVFFGLNPVGHPSARQIILHENWPDNMFPLRKDFDWKMRPGMAKGEYHFHKVEGEGIYEIPVGPIHAGIIEPGHFRFSVAGESIVLLEPRLGYTHKGSEKLFEMLPLDAKVRLSEKISGDSSFSHSLAFCQALEQLSDTVVPDRALYLRVIYAELERLANHFGDIGAIMTDTGFNFGGANGGRLREMIMQINERLTGSRFLRGVNMIGGVTKDIAEKERFSLGKDLEMIRKDFSEVITVAENSSSLLNRLKGTGSLALDIANDSGVVGVIGRSVGMSKDARIDYSYAAYGKLPSNEIAIEHDGDVYARFRVRVKEVYSSIKLIQDALASLPEGRINASAGSFRKGSLSVGIVEGWRGDIVYFVTTDKEGNISRVFPRDPSFINWDVLKDAGFNNVVPDFPLINKSFNMSYTGNDL